MTEPHKRRWFRYSLRTLIVVVAAVGAVSGWVAYHFNWIWQRHDARERLDRVVFVVYSEDGPWNSPPWPLGWFGERGFGASRFRVPEDTSDTEIARVQKLFPETTVVRLPPYSGPAF
jgi:hypothetical protein